MRDRSVLCSAASKAYAMTGWRCGWAIAPAKVIAAFNAMQGHSTSNVSSITQKAAVAALTGPQDSVTTMLRRVPDPPRSRLGVADGGSAVHLRQAARGVLPVPVRRRALAPAGVRTTAEFAEALLNEAHVALTAGEGFDAPGFFRISYATSLDRLREGVTRIHEFVHASAETSRRDSARRSR